MRAQINISAMFFLAGAFFILGPSPRAEDFTLDQSNSPADALSTIKNDPAVPSAPQAKAVKIESAPKNIIGIFHNNYCKTHPDICNNPNDPRNPSYCTTHPEDPMCTDDPSNPEYCNYHPAECGEIPPPLPSI